ncbi:MAG: hypothetical protein CMM79_06425 [Rhodospirillaceae bacterium]|nr:hypothetical protein [Rhodospirillaceae bacterium]
MPSIRAIDAKYIGCSGIRRTQMFDNLFATLFIEQKYTKMPKLQMVVNLVDDVARGQIFHAFVSN